MIQGWENIACQAIMLEKLIFGIDKVEVETPFLCMGQSTSDEKWGIINDWIYQIDMLLTKMSRQTLCRRQTHLFAKQAAKSLLATKKIEMHDPTLS